MVFLAVKMSPGKCRNFQIHESLGFSVTNKMVCGKMNSIKIHSTKNSFANERIQKIIENFISSTFLRLRLFWLGGKELFSLLIDNMWHILVWNLACHHTIIRVIDEWLVPWAFGMSRRFISGHDRFTIVHATSITQINISRPKKLHREFRQG